MPHIPPWTGRRVTDAIAYCRRVYGDRCWLCGQRIGDDDYTVDHVKPRKHYPDLTWEPSNWRPAHGRKHPEFGCPGNYGRSNRRRRRVTTWTAPGW